MRRGISRRWFVNTVGLITLILVILITALSLNVQSSVYTGMSQALRGRMDELLNVFSSGENAYKTPAEFSATARNYIENFPDKHLVEIMAINAKGQIFVNSTGFAPDQTQPMQDYEDALLSPDGYGSWTGTLNNGEKIMAMTRVVRDSESTILGTIRYMVSLERADKQISTVVLALVIAGILIMLIIFFSGFYFLRSIINPVRDVTSTAKQISQGDFEVRITKKKEDEIGQLCDAINDMAQELGAADRMKNDFISSVSHELRTPLTAIKGWAETLSAESDPVMQERGMQIIVRETERLSGIVEELLDFSRLQNGRMQIRMQKLDLLAELEAAVYLFTNRASQEKRELLFDAPDTLPPISGDSDKLKQVFVNIIDNALKYTEEGGKIVIKAQEQDGYVRITVSDDGCGIPAEHLPNVKKKFYKANQHVRGSGIGLAVTEDFVSMHHGSLTVDSSEHIGTTVTISLPTMATTHAHPEWNEEAQPAAVQEADSDLPSKP